MSETAKQLVKSIRLDCFWILEPDISGLKSQKR